LISAAIFSLVLFLVWKHNNFTYKRRFSEWDSSFICLRCGAVSPHELSRP
jgi:hypothetical protein